MKNIDDINAELAASRPYTGRYVDRREINQVVKNVTEAQHFKDLSDDERLTMADKKSGTWETYFSGPSIMAFEQKAEEYARSVGGEIDWTVVALNEFVQRSIGEGKTWDQIKDFAVACIAGYQREWERHDISQP